MSPEAETALRNEVLDLRFALRDAQEELACAREEIDRLRAQIAAYTPVAPPEPYMVDDYLYVQVKASDHIGEIAPCFGEWHWTYRPNGPDSGPTAWGDAPTRDEAAGALLAAARKRLSVSS